MAKKKAAKKAKKTTAKKKTAKKTTAPKTAAKRKKPDRAVRLSVSFKPADYAELATIAREKSVSVAWVVRQAVHAYLSDRAPLFRPKTESNG